MRRAFAVLPLLLCVSVLVPSPGGAQTADQPVAGYVTKRWTTADGLPHNWISAIVQTRDGFLWLGTNNAGVVRFDGVTFKTFNVLNTPALPSDTITRLFEDADGTLWIASGAGLARYRDDAFVAESLPNELSARAIVDLQTDRNGRLWLAVDEAVARRDGDSWTIVMRGAGVQRIWHSTDGTLWMATRDGLVEWRDRVVRTLRSGDGLPGGDVLALLEDRAGRLWIGTAQGLAYLQRGAEASIERMLSGVPISALFEDRDGVLWIGSRNRWITRWPDGTLSQSIVESETQDGSAAVITGDREGHVWVGMEGWQGGLYRLRRERASMLPLEGAACRNTGAMTAASDGTLWLATFCPDGQGVLTIRDGQVTRQPGPAFVASMFADPDGSVWLGTYGGRLFHSPPSASSERERRFEEIPAAPTRDSGNVIASLYRDAGGWLWLGTRKGAFRWGDGEWRSLTSRDGLASDEVFTIAGIRDGAIWLGMTGAISRYEDGRVTTYRVGDGVPQGAVRALHVDADGAVWIGTYGGGLARLKNGRITRYGLRNGVLDSSVHRIIEDDQGYLWLSGDRGIRRVSKRDLNAIADEGGLTLDVTVLNEADGMRSVESNGMAQPAGWRMPDGTLYFPTQAGVVRVDPARLAGPAPAPQPHIEEAIVDGALADARGSVEAGPGYRDIAIRYTAPAFGKPELVQFRYRLEGHSDEWIDVGTRREISFATLRPGRYRFLLAAGSGSEWSEASAPLVLVLQPSLYQRPSVQIGAGLLGLAGIVGAALGYVRRTRRRANELEQAVAERTRELSAAHDRISAAHDRIAVVNQDLVAAQQIAEQAHLQLLSVFDQLEIGVLVLDPRGIVRYASASAQRVLRKHHDALIDQSWSAVLPIIEADRARIKAQIERRSAGDGRVPTQMVVGGTRYWIEIDVRDEPPPGDGRILYMYDVAEVSDLPGEAGSTGMFGLVGRSTAMLLLYKQLQDVARMDATVLIHGETGVGKELVARAIHRESLRAAKPFIPVNAADLSESLVASQLFGHRRGAFTGAVDDQVGVFEAADGGTVFLDEIGDMPPTVQVSLLRVLQEREITRLGDTQPRRVDVRFLAATHRDLAREVDSGRFREDLLYRIRVTTVLVPPLRQRRDDIPLLVEAFVTDAARQAARVVPMVSLEAMEALMRYDWPGNVRQLWAAIERSLVNATGDLVRREDLPPEVVGLVSADGNGDVSERDRLMKALRQTKGNRAEAARLLGINRATLYRWLRRWGVDSESER